VLTVAPLDQESPGSSPRGAMPTVNNRGLLFGARPSAASPGGAMTGATAPAILFCGLDLRLRTHEGCETRSELRLRPHLFVIGSGSVWGQVSSHLDSISSQISRSAYCQRAGCITGRRPLFLLADGYTIPLPNGWSSIANPALERHRARQPPEILWLVPVRIAPGGPRARPRRPRRARGSGGVSARRRGGTWSRRRRRHRQG